MIFLMLTIIAIFCFIAVMSNGYLALQVPRNTNFSIRNTVSLLSAIFILFYMVLARDVFVTVENLSPECSKLSEIFDNALIKVLNK